MERLVKGATIEVAHPFIRESITLWDEDGGFETLTWRPGTRPEMVPPDDAENVADGIGSQTLTHAYPVDTYRA